MKSEFVRLKYAVCLLGQLLLAETHLDAQAPASHTRRFISPDANINFNNMLALCQVYFDAGK